MNGQYGCAAVVSRIEPIARSGRKVVHVGEDSCSIIVAQPRYLIVAISVQQLRIIIISAHIPHSSCSDRSAVLSALCVDIRKHVDPKYPAYLCIDANTSLPESSVYRSTLHDIGTSSRPSTDHFLFEDSFDKLKFTPASMHRAHCSDEFSTGTIA